MGMVWSTTLRVGFVLLFYRGVNVRGGVGVRIV